MFNGFFYLLYIANDKQNIMYYWFWLKLWILFSCLVQRLYGLVLSAENGHGYGYGHGHGQNRISPGSSSCVSGANSPAKSYKKSALENTDFVDSGYVSPTNRKNSKEKMSKTLNDNKTRNKLTSLGILPFEIKNRKQSFS